MSAERVVAMRDVLIEHLPSTSNHNCCSCGMWFDVERDGPFDFVHAEHVAQILGGVA